MNECNSFPGMGDGGGARLAASARRDLGKESGLVLRDGEVLLPAAEDMLPIACQMFAEGKTVAVEHAEPVYLRNNVAWKKLPGKE